jgi:tetratricopeptide (TPR) repeat protein
MRYALCCLFAILILLSSFVAGPLLARGAERSLTEGTAIEIDNSYPTPHNNLGVVYLKQDRPEQAEKEFLQAVRLDPQYSKAQYNLAVALFHQKRYADAAKAYLKARDLDREYVSRRDNSEHTRKKLQSALEQAAEDEESTKELKRMQKWLAPNY